MNRGDWMKKALTIAGSDSSGGAGIQADLKTFSALGVYGMSAITAVTAQNTQGVVAVQEIEPQFIGKQIDAIFEDIAVDAVKIGMVSQVESIEVIADRLSYYKPKNVVLDPVMVSTSGYHLLHVNAKQALIEKLLPLATIFTPNIPEAEVITGLHITTLADMEQAGLLIRELGPKSVLIKGGHLKHEATDILLHNGTFKHFISSRIHTKHTHGTGCTLSSAIAAYLARGYTASEAVQAAKEYITVAIEHSLAIGKGIGPTNHFYALYKKAGIITD